MRDMLIRRRSLTIAMLVLGLLSTVMPLQSREHKKKEDYGHGLTTEISAPESEVLEAVQSVVNNGMIQGTKEYDKDRDIERASPISDSTVFPRWTGPGEVFFKERAGVLDPRGFYESNDIGTLAVRYVVESKGPTKTMLRIDAIFVEDFRRTVHPSDGSVENAEFKDVQDHVNAAELLKKQTEEVLAQGNAERAKKTLEKNERAEASALALAQSSAETLEQRVQHLRHQVERVVKAPGAELKAAPYRTAANLKTLEAGAEVVILADTPYWFGVETEDGRHGWIYHAQLEPLP